MINIVYVVTGDLSYAKAAAVSALSAPEDIPIAFLCDRSCATYLRNLFGESERIQIVTPRIPSKLTKIQATRWLKMVGTRKLELPGVTAYLDCDTFLTADFNPALLNVATIGFAISRFPTIDQARHVDTEELEYSRQTLPPNAAQFNGGVFAWRNEAPAAQRTLEAWWTEYQRFGRVDQLALTRALHHGLLTVEELPVSYNFPSDWLSESARAVHRPGVVHCVGGQVESGEFFRLAGVLVPDAIAKFKELGGELP